MTISEADLRRAIFNLIQPMRRGKVVKVDGLRTTLGSLIGFGEGDGYIGSSPFGYIAKPTPNTFAYFNNLNGDVLAPIILGWQHQRRPDPTGVGGSILYSTEVTGNIVRAFIEMFNDGQIDFKSVTGSLIRMTPTGNILIGSALSSEAIVLGNAFMTLYNVHTHVGNMGAPTGPPQLPMGVTHISAKAFTEI